MTATTVERLTDFAGVLPGKGTFPIAAATLLLKGTIAVADASQNANVPAAGRNAIGKVKATYDNRLGVAGDIDAEIEYGVFGFLFTGTTPFAGEYVYVVDNQTVSIDSSSGTRGIAGIVSEVRGTKAFVWMGPHVAALLNSDEALSIAEVKVSLGDLRVNDGSAVPAFSNGTADGFSLINSKLVAIRVNNTSTTVLMGNCKFPDDLDVTQPVTLHVRGSRSGTTDTGALLTPHAWAQHDGALHDAGSDLFAGNTSAFTSALAKSLQTVTATMTAPAAGDSVSFTLVSGSLPTDDLFIESIWFTCARAIAG